MEWLTSKAGRKSALGCVAVGGESVCGLIGWDELLLAIRGLMPTRERRAISRPANVSRKAIFDNNFIEHIYRGKWDVSNEKKMFLSNLATLEMAYRPRHLTSETYRKGFNSRGDDNPIMRPIGDSQRRVILRLSPRATSARPIAAALRSPLGNCASRDDRSGGIEGHRGTGDGSGRTHFQDHASAGTDDPRPRRSAAVLALEWPSGCPNHRLRRSFQFRDP